jgi:hypothetical protein
MGTRHLIAVKLDNDLKVAQYGQWDGYPDGQGVSVLTFLRSLAGDRRDDFASKVRALRWATADDLSKAQAEIEASGKSVAMTFPEYSRDTSADLLHLIDVGRVTVVKDDRSFAGDGLFCEWAYLVDLDKNTLEVYEGFQQGTVHGYFANYERGGSEYAPVTLRQSFDLSALPTDHEFLAAFSDDSETQAAVQP